MNHMFSSYLAPHLNISPRRPSQASDNASVASFSTAGSRGSRSSKGSKGSKAAGQDYQVLLTELQKRQAEFQQARSQLASSLLRVGEYHVRRGEYDEAMLALRDSLGENRSVVRQSLSALPSLDVSVTCDESLISGMTASQWSGAHGGAHAAAQCGAHTPRSVGTAASSSTYLSSVTAGSKDAASSAPDAETVAVQRKSLDDMITTLSSLGKVNSLRGEDLAAMKYYDEKTKIQALRMDIEEQLSTRSSVGCLGPGAFFGEINEDVKALDELFRGISFRKDAKKTESARGGRILEEDARHEHALREGAAGAMDERSPSPDAASGSTADELSGSTASRTSKRGKADTHRRRRTRVTVDTEVREDASHLPPLRQTRPQSTPADGGHGRQEDGELADALDAYRTMLDAHGGRTSDHHEREYAAFLRQHEALRGSAAAPDRDAERSPSSRREAARRREWTLALDVYEAALAAQREATSRVPFPPGTPRKRTASDFQQDSRTSVASTLIAMGGVHYKLHDVERELERYEAALAVYRETLGEDHPHVAGTLKNIGMVLAEQGRLDEAMDRFREARRIYAALADGRGDGPCCDVASALSCMGNVQNRRGDLEDALRLYGEALAAYTSVSARARDLGGRSRLALQEVAATLKIMGMVRTKRGEHEAAMACFRDALGILRGHFGERGAGPAVVSLLARIGGLLARTGRPDEAMAHYQEAYDLATRTFGTADHPEVAQILHYIGGAHQRGGRLAEAMRCYKNAAKIYQTTLGRNDPAAATTLVCIGSLHYVEKNLDGAMSYYTEALRLNRAAYGTKHPDVLPTMKSIALIQAKKENFAAALEIFTEVLRIKRAEAGPGHPEVAGAHKRIGNVHYQRGDLAGADEEYRKALAIYRRSLGQEHQTTRSAQAIVDKVAKEMKEAPPPHPATALPLASSETATQPPPSSGTSFFKRAPKGYESL